MSNYCVICGVEIPEGRQVCPFCIDEVKRSTDFDGLVAMLRSGLDVEFVDIFVEDESIRLIMPPIKSVKINGDRIEVIL